MVVRELCKITSKDTEKSVYAEAMSRLRGALGIVTLLGLTWIFAFFAISDAGLTFHYLFAISNSLQGLFIFLFYCLLKTDVQIAFKKSLARRSSGMDSFNRGKTNGVFYTVNTTDLWILFSFVLFLTLEMSVVVFCVVFNFPNQVVLMMIFYWVL